ncbi:MAG: hypothetical protein A2173_06840 [Planctomycetes bacterium RBG_13_44_8b]|nr:MAG: hypothetical protein A2173_06840 [Planctomycetes bacterium RBG_13_44_8b]
MLFSFPSIGPVNIKYLVNNTIVMRDLQGLISYLPRTNPYYEVKSGKILKNRFGSMVKDSILLYIGAGFTDLF